MKLTVAVSSVVLFLSSYIERVSYSWKIRLRMCQMPVSQTLSIRQKAQPFGTNSYEFFFRESSKLALVRTPLQKSLNFINTNSRPWKSLKIAVGAGKSLNFNANLIVWGELQKKRSKHGKAFRMTEIVSLSRFWYPSWRAGKLENLMSNNFHKMPVLKKKKEL